MRRAGRASWREVLQHWPSAQRLLVVCGPGNNGGDGFVLATHALCAGRDVRVLTLAHAGEPSVLGRRAREAYFAAGGAVHAFDGHLPAVDLVIDALFGIGLSRALDADAAGLVAAINAQPAPVLALDLPSGVVADTGRCDGTAVRAARTLEFIGAKPGLRTAAALDHVGALSLASLEIEDLIQAETPVAWALAPGALADWLKPRARDSHKGHNGRVLCVGGQHGHGGAVLLCAHAALRTGAGLVDIATRSAHVAPALARIPEAMAHGCDDADQLTALLSTADCIAVGPGLGRSDWSAALWAHALESGRSLVVDADALNLLALHPQPLPAGAVITPHPAEAARLLGTKTADIHADRYAAARELATRFACVAVLKGAGTIIAAPGETPCVIAAGNPGMSTGGTGDVLTGVIAALRAQGLAPFDAACAGALLHAVAGDSAAAEAGPRGMIASDLLPWRPRPPNPDGR